jgi:hypothetical protein
MGYFTRISGKIIICLLLLAINQIQAQEIPDTTVYIVAKGEDLRISLAWTNANHGNIQWQVSTGNDSWADIPAAVSKNLKVKADTDAWFRAKVISGTCDPVYSAITGLNVLNVLTLNTDSITGTRVVVTCAVDTTAGKISETGVLIDTKAIPDSTSTRITEASGKTIYSVNIENLTPGKKYYVRVYEKLQNGRMLMGNILNFITYSIHSIHRVDLTDSTAVIWYSITGDTASLAHGVFYGTAVPDTNSDSRTGQSADDKLRSLITGLDPGMSYYAIPWFRKYSTYYLGDTVSFTTYTDYSKEIVDTSAFKIAHKITWKPYATAIRISQPGFYADYGRIKRVGTSDTLLLVYHGGENNQDWLNVYMRKSYDNGNTWQDQQIMADISKYSNYWRFCNPELIQLANGWILLAYVANGNPETNENCYIHILTSKDRGKTWEGPALIQTGRSWEPSLVQLPHGEIEMFYSSEADWWPPVEGEYLEQEIHMIHSTDNGHTWSYPQTVAYYPGKRDGMPVPLLLRGNRGVVFTIETVGASHSPYIVKRALAAPWTLTSTNFENGPYRWVVGNFSGHGGAPYIIQLPTGETVLSAHIYKGGDWHQNNYMQVMIGDNNARQFTNLSTPWGILGVNESAVNNSLFLKDSTTIIAVSGRNFRDGSGGIYWLEGTIVPVE